MIPLLIALQQPTVELSVCTKAWRVWLKHQVCKENTLTASIKHQSNVRKARFFNKWAASACMNNFVEKQTVEYRLGVSKRP